MLRKEFIVLGSFTKTQSFIYFQMIKFLKNLKLLVKKLRKEQIQQKILLKKQTLVGTNQKNKQKLEKSILFLTEKVLKNKLNNIDEECRKTKFIEYLQDVVQKHRKKNIYFYLATLSDSQKYLKKIKQFTKRHATFLFGIDLNTLNNFNNLSDETVAGLLASEYLKIIF